MNELLNRDALELLLITVPAALMIYALGWMQGQQHERFKSARLRIDAEAILTELVNG